MFGFYSTDSHNFSNSGSFIYQSVAKRSCFQLTYKIVNPELKLVSEKNPRKTFLSLKGAIFCALIVFDN